MSSILEYLAGLRRYGHVPGRIGTATIGRTTYAIGSFVTPEHPAPEGSRAAREGRPVPATERFVLMVVGTTRHGQWTTDVPFLPASYRRSGRTTFYDATGKTYYISGWDNTEQAFWLNDAAWMDDSPYENNPPRPTQLITIRWDESFEAAMGLAGPEVLARIKATESKAPFRVHRLNDNGDVVETRGFDTRELAYDFFAGCDKDAWTGVFH